MKYLIPIIFLFSLLACTPSKMENTMQSFPKLKDVQDAQWKKLAEKKIYFGHQSVGYNIIDGIKDLMRENPQIKLNIAETHEPKDFSGPIFAHSPVGENTDPKSKIDAFAGFMDQGLGNLADIAFFKFCYVDINSKTDIEALFYEYKKALTRLQKEHPGTTFIHLTAPLTMQPSGLKPLLKKIIKIIIGRPVSGNEDNINREQFNQKLREEFGSSPQTSSLGTQTSKMSQPSALPGTSAAQHTGALKNSPPTTLSRVFDLALFESTFPDGRRATFKRDNKNHFNLVPDYTNDGGHLNEAGRKIVAEQLLIFLANSSK